VRLVGVDGARIGGELPRHVQARMAGRDQDVPEHAVAVELEAAVDGVDALDARRVQAAVPAAASAQALDVREELADGGMEAVAQRVDEGPGRPPAYRGAERQARERGRAAVAVALRPHLALADRGRTAAEGRGRIVLEA